MLIEISRVIRWKKFI